MHAREGACPAAKHACLASCPAVHLHALHIAGLTSATGRQHMRWHTNRDACMSMLQDSEWHAPDSACTPHTILRNRQETKQNQAVHSSYVGSRQDCIKGLLTWSSDLCFCVCGEPSFNRPLPRLAAVGEDLGLVSAVVLLLCLLSSQWPFTVTATVLSCGAVCPIGVYVL